MPEIARFSGLVVAMFYRDHEPPQAHVRLAEYEATVRIEDGVVVGKLPSWARERVRQWCASHRQELRDNWTRARIHGPLRRIGPVE